VAVQVWIGEKPDNPNERKAIIALANGLDRLEGLYVMVANFSVGGRTIDLVILKPDAIFILELKHCDGKVYGSVNGPWKVVSKNGSVKQLNPGRKNPYNQVVSYFYSFTNFLNDHKHEIVGTQKASDVDFRTAKRVIVIVPTVEDGSEIELDWKVQVKGLDELPTYLLTERSSGIELTDDELLRIPRLLHCEPWQELNDLIAGVMPPWAETPSEPVFTPPAPAPAIDIPIAQPWWGRALRALQSWPNGALLVFALAALLLTTVLVRPIFTNGQVPDRVAVTAAPIPTIPEIGEPLDVANGVWEGRQQVGRRWDSGALRWVPTDSETADVLVTLETVDFNNGQIKLNWLVENRRSSTITMPLVPQNIVITDNQMEYQIDPQRSQPPGVLRVEPNAKANATVIVPQSVRSYAITLRITLMQQPFGETNWIVNVPQ
jgi:hypothetical protein